MVVMECCHEQDWGNMAETILERSLHQLTADTVLMEGQQAVTRYTTHVQPVGPVLTRASVNTLHAHHAQPEAARWFSSHAQPPQGSGWQWESVRLRTTNMEGHPIILTV